MIGGLTCGAGLTITCLSGLGDGTHLNSFGADPRRSGNIRLLPVTGFTYRQSTLKFMESARFRTPRQAIQAIGRASVPFYVSHVTNPFPSNQPGLPVLI